MRSERPGSGGLAIVAVGVGHVLHGRSFQI